MQDNNNAETPPFEPIITPDPWNQVPPPPPPIVTEPKKPNKKLVIILSIIILLVLGAIIYMMFFYKPAAPAPVKPANQNQQQTPETPNDNTPSTSPEQDENIVVTYDEEYIYINDWGIKLKLDSGTTVLSYSSRAKTEADELYITIVSNSLYTELTENLSESELKEFIPGNYIVRSKDTKLTTASGGQYDPVFSDGEYNYFAYQLSGYNLGSENVAKYSEEIQDDFEKAFENLNKPETYSKL